MATIAVCVCVCLSVCLSVCLCMLQFACMLAASEKDLARVNNYPGKIRNLRLGVIYLLLYKALHECYYYFKKIIIIIIINYV